MSDFVDFPLKKLLNRENIFSRLEKVEGKGNAKPSAKVGQVSQMTQNTGNLVVDGSIVVIDRSTGAQVIKIDDDGIFMQNSADAWFNFEDASGGTGTINIAATPTNVLEIVNIATTPAGTTAFYLKIGANTRRVLNLSGTGTAFNESADDVDFIIGSDTNQQFFYLDAALEKLTIDGAVVINESGADRDFRVESDTNINFLFLDASAESLSIDGAVSINASMADRDFIIATDAHAQAFMVDGQLNRVEMKDTGNVAVHIFEPFDGGTFFINEPGYDINFAYYGANDTELIFGDAGNNRVGIGTSAPGYKLDVAGDVNIVSAGNTYRVNGSDIQAGWIETTVTWTRTGNHTFTLSGDLTTTYRKGTKIRYKDGGSYEYGVVYSSSHAAGTTTVTLITNTDYAMAAATITDKYLSYIENPEGFPQWFNFDAAPSGFSAVPSSPVYRWTTNASTIFIVYSEANNGTSNATTFGATAPCVAAQTVAGVAGTLVDNGALLTTAGRVTMSSGSAAITFRSNMSTGAWTAANGKRAVAEWYYEF